MEGRQADAARNLLASAMLLLESLQALLTQEPARRLPGHAPVLRTFGRVGEQEYVRIVQYDGRRGCWCAEKH